MSNANADNSYIEDLWQSTNMIDTGDAAVVRDYWEKELKRLQKL